MKKFLLLPFVSVLILAAVFVWFYVNVRPVSADKEFKNFLINKGSSAGQIGSKLESAGLIKSSLAFKIYLQVSGSAGRIQAGEYRLTPSFSLFQMVDQLLKGPAEVWVTIPEGLRREEIAQRYAKGLERDNIFIDEFLAASQGAEGMLFPDTYLFPREVSAVSIVKKMKQTFQVKTSDLASSSGLSLEEKITLASIVERETKTAAERPVVAGIYMNRLRIGMALQADATVQYAVANVKLKTQNSELPEKWWEPLLKEDLSINSPYNTYKFPGLPPGPIASPGLSSMTAAFNPEETDFLYYIHDSEGKIHYARNLDEQNSNISKYLR